MRNLTTLILLTIVLLGCTSNDKMNLNEGFFSDRGLISAEMEIAPNEITPDRSDQVSVTPDRKIIKTGFLEIKSTGIGHSRLRIDSLSKKYDCFVSSENFMESSNRWTYNLTIRIAAKSFDEFLETIINGPDKIKNKTIDASDVTEQYYDLKSRLETNLAVEKRYRDLLNKAQVIKEILEIEKSLGEIRGEIESQQGRLNRLESQIAFSTLNISLYQDKTLKQTTTARDPFSTRLGRSLVNGWNGLIGFLIGFLSFWPLWLILIGAYIAFIQIKKKRNG
jgi:hypothetical protein